MHRQSFIPARNSRHRIAALSLYRALLRSAGTIAIPKDSKARHSRNEIQHVIRKRFVDNRPLTSFRLVYASMAAGYKFLSLFSKALDQTSPEYAQITSHLRNSRPLKPAPSRPKQSPPARPPAKEPFLVNISQNDSPHYVASYTLHSKTRTPKLCTAAFGQPFLRLKKPQPPSLSKMVGRKGVLYWKKMTKFKDADEDLKQDAALEDEWDALMAAQMWREGLSVEDSDSPTSTYSWSAQLSKLWWEWQLEKIWQDWLARGVALNRIVEEQRGQDRVRNLASSAKARPRGGNNSTAVQTGKTATERNSSVRPKVSVFSGSALPHIEAIDAQLGHLKIVLPKAEVDPFTGRRWNALVESSTQRITYWIRGQVNRRDKL
ncbi:hypothetical protein E4U42_005156 [Claviceps africana]|uniref:Complex 1 LYR protein domain-containing protein n=1 Tax=Claviceps africana TaxID=83212 RepID=A0A8K0J485_9HYPO|nr:hypothetical protein E4U42_005156 [Claviceps africana]